jgi:hypothetical protein
MGVSNLRKHLVNYAIPPILIAFARSTSANLKYLSNFHTLGQNRRFYNIHSGENCFIVCNGPSINEQNLAALKGQTVISVSSGYHHPDFQTYSPRYHCTPRLSIGQVATMAQTTLDTAIKWLREMHASVGDAEVFHSIDDAPLIRRLDPSCGRRVNYLCMAGSFSGNKMQTIDITRVIPGVTTVPIMALMIALYMGFKEIYLLGVDHDSYRTRVYNQFFDPRRQFGGGVTGFTGPVDTPVAEELLIYFNIFMQYRSLLSIAHSRGVRIYNATRGGALEELPRVDLDEVLTRSGQI